VVAIVMLASLAAATARADLYIYVPANSQLGSYETKKGARHSIVDNWVPMSYSRCAGAFDSDGKTFYGSYLCDNVPYDPYAAEHTYGGGNVLWPAAHNHVIYGNWTVEYGAQAIY
jgi:hypothetical protein